MRDLFSNFSRRPDIWLPSYLMASISRTIASLRRPTRHTHLVFFVCDHFEPRHGITHDRQAFDRLEAWKSGYANFQGRCRASLGIVPMHTWFYPPHHGVEHLPTLSEMVFDGLGELELHYHHENDTSVTLRQNLLKSIEDFQRWGFLLQSGEKPETSFGFIHGDWALDNSCAGKFCGVNNELQILEDLGCWGDFTMPSGNKCQTRKINSIYYAIDNPNLPKSHDSGLDARVGNTTRHGLFMMQGPLAINWRAPDHPRIENASLTTRNWGRPDRIRKWIDCNIHVQGRDDWLFIKLHTHGAIEQDFDGLFGERAFEMYRTFQEQYNDGVKFSLHCVTARQAYNIAKAAEHGKAGSPAEWVDFLHPPQPHRFYTLDKPHNLLSCSVSSLTIELDQTCGPAVLLTRVGPASRIFGALSSIAIDAKSGTIRLAPSAPSAIIELVLNSNFMLVGHAGADVVRSHSQNPQVVRLVLDDEAVCVFSETSE